MSSSYNFVLDGSENGGGYDNSPNYSIELPNNPANIKVNNIPQGQCNHSELLNLMHEIMRKIDRQGAELISLRNGISIIKGRVCGELHKAKLTLPSRPKETLGASFKNLVIELVESAEKTYDKYIRSSWRQIIIDDVTRQCSWRGTESKMCVRGLRTTLAIRNAFKQKFALEDGDFDRVTQKYFQYAQERMARLGKADAKKIH